MSLLWLRVALGCYAVGLLYALVTLTRTSDLLSRIALHAAYLGMVFHFVSLSEAVAVRPTHAGFRTQRRIGTGFSGHGCVHDRLPGVPNHCAGHRGLSSGVRAYFCRRHRPAATLADVPGLADRVAIRAYRTDLHWLCGTDCEFRRQLALPARGAQPQVEEGQRSPVPPAGATGHWRHRLPLAASRFSLHDP